MPYASKRILFSRNMRRLEAAFVCKRNFNFAVETESPFLSISGDSNAPSNVLKQQKGKTQLSNQADFRQNV